MTQRPGYRAFISYSHSDKEIAEDLHRWLERFRVPDGLPRAGESFAPAFRDDEELAASEDLPQRISEALATSDAMIILASPRAARSKWVNKEVLEFRKAKPDAPCLALIVEGRPDVGPRSREQCFPPAFRREVKNGRLTRRVRDPLAPDLQKEGRDNTYLRLVAGLLRVNYAELTQRHAKREEQIRRLRLRQLAKAYAIPAHAAIDGDRPDLAMKYALAFALEADDPTFDEAPELASAGRTGGLENRMRSVLRGHEDDVFTAAFSLDGTRIVTASGDGTARVWGAASGAEIVTLRGHESYVRSAAFSQDGTRIVTASSDGTARIWDAASGAEIAVLRGHEDTVLTATFSPDGSRIVTASLDRTARVWDAASGAEIAVLRGHEDWVLTAAFSPDGTRIVTASGDDTARVWDAP